MSGKGWKNINTCFSLIEELNKMKEMNDVNTMYMYSLNLTVWGDRARWIVESVFLHSPDNIGVLGMADLPQACPYVQRLWSDSPHSNNSEGNYFAGCLRLPRPTSVPPPTLTLEQ